MVVTKNRPVKPSSGSNVETIFEEFSQAQNSNDILLSFQKLKAAAGCANVDIGKEVYTCLKAKLQSWKCKSLWELLDARAKHKEYGNGKICEDVQVLVIGAGPIGLRTAIEVALLGAKVIVVEKRTIFGRNNVLHLWPFLIQDFRSLGAKKFYGKFCAGSLDHISIRVLQCMLMKTALLLGVQIFAGVTFEKIVEPCGDAGWRCSLEPPFHPASQVDYDMVVGADGKKNVLPDFPQIEMRGSLAIGITLNLVYHGTKQEAAITEVSGLAYHFKPQYFDNLYQKTGVRLENFVYYKNETHYFVMTAVKSSLLARGALLVDYPKPDDLLAASNINPEKLKQYALDAVHYGTEGQLVNQEFVINDRGKPDIAVFDFTSLKKAEHAARIVERKGHRLLMALVGDSLIEPFWPTGSGCARGVLSALDVAWMLRSFAMDKPPLQVLSERESVYKLLSATTVNNLRKKYEEYTINPFSRYVDVNLKRVKEVYHLYDSDDPVNADFRVTSPTAVNVLLQNTRRRMSVGTRPAAGKGTRNRRKSSSDDLDDKKEKSKRRISASKNLARGIKTQQSSSDDLDDDKETKERKAKKGVGRRRSSDDGLAGKSGGKKGLSKSAKSLKKQRSRQSSESADEDAQGRRRRKLDRENSREAGKESLGTISESVRKTGNSGKTLQMKQRSTKRWRLFGGAKPNLKSSDQDENIAQREQEDIKQDKLRNKKDKKKNDESEKQNSVKTAKQGSIRETYVVATQKKINQENNCSKTSQRTSIRKPSELRGAKNDSHFVHGGYLRSNSSSAFTTPHSTPVKTRRLPFGQPNSEMKRQNSDMKRQISEIRRPNTEVKRTESFVRNSRRTARERIANSPSQSGVSASKKVKSSEELGRKGSMRAKLASAGSPLQNIRGLSPAAQRTAPVLMQLTPEKESGHKPSDGGVVAACAGIAAVIALTTPLAIEEREPLKEFQIERQKILSRSSFQDKLDGTARNFRRDLTSALDNADGSPKPVKRFFSFSSSQRNVKQKLENDESEKTLTLPKRKVGRHSLKLEVCSSPKDIPSALDSAVDILIKQYHFNELQNTLRLMLNIFRCILKDPEDEMPRRICAKGDLFHSLVWNIREAKLFMVVSGWMEIGDFILFPKSKTVHEPLRVLMQNYRALSEQQTLDISCPQFSSVNVETKCRQVNSKTLRTQKIRRTSSQLAMDDGKDTGSHSSDSGMGFSETTSERNIVAAISTDYHGDEDKEANICRDDVMLVDNHAGSSGVEPSSRKQRASVNMDPRMYLEDSVDVGKPVVDPLQYIKENSDQSWSAVEGKDNESRKLNTNNVCGEDQNESLPPYLVASPEQLQYSAQNNDEQTTNSALSNEERMPKRGDETQDTLQKSDEHCCEILEEIGRSPAKESSHCSESQRKEQRIERDPTRSHESFQELKHHRWEIMEESLPTLQHSCEEMSYSMPPVLDDQLSFMSDIRDVSCHEAIEVSDTIDALVESMNEPMEYQYPDMYAKDPAYSDVNTKDPGNSDPEVFTENRSKYDSKRHKKNELDDLFDTLDFVTDELQSAPRVVCIESTAKKNRRHPKSTETSRRREQFARCKQLQAKEEQTSPMPKRKTRNTTRARDAVAMETVNSKPVKAVGRREMPMRAAKAGKSGSKKPETTMLNDEERSDVCLDTNVSAVQFITGSSGSDEDRPKLRRSRRIAESLGKSRKAVLTLESSYSIEESSADLNQAFMNTLGERCDTTQETVNESRDSTTGHRKRPRVRRKSSIVKSNKTRARAKRGGYKGQKDRSTDA